MSSRKALERVADMRGRHFAFLGLICTTWVAGRIGFLSFSEDRTSHVVNEGVSPMPSQPREVGSPARVVASEPTVSVCCFGGMQKALVPLPAVRQLRSINFGGAGVAPFVPARVDEAASVQPAGPVTIAAHPSLQLQKPGSPPATDKRLQLYLYSFLRSGGKDPALAVSPQYGGGQSGFVATYDLGTSGKSGLAILMRGAVAHENTRERELAGGVRWRPSQRLPVTVTAERRFRANRPDAFAAYVAGGVSDVRLPLKVRFEGYAQGGVVLGRDGGAFADFIARGDRKLMNMGRLAIAGGAGLWGGGQADIYRIDMGPTARADLATGRVSVRLSADWRFRIAGNAKPGNSPAVTLSTSF